MTTAACARAVPLTRVDKASDSPETWIRWHSTPVLCSADADGWREHREFAARCLPDGTHLCPRCDPDWPHSSAAPARPTDADTAAGSAARIKASLDAAARRREERAARRSTPPDLT